MKLGYTKHINTYDPIAVSWIFDGKQIELCFDEPISAIFSEQLDNVVVELYQKGKLNFYSSTGELVSTEALPECKGYLFRGINRNTKSETGIAFLFYPIIESVSDKWKDTEQFELMKVLGQRLGPKLGIYR